MSDTDMILALVVGGGLRKLLRWQRDLPQQEERARLLREVREGRKHRQYHECRGGTGMLRSHSNLQDLLHS